MKPLPLILVVVLATAAGAAGGYLGAGLQAPAAPASPALGLPVTAAEKPAERSADQGALLLKLDGMSQELAALQSEVDRLREGDVRQPVTAASAPQAELPSATGLAILNKQAIQTVIEEDRAEQARKREEERRQREIEALQERAERTAKKLGLDAAQQKILAEVYTLDRDRMDEMRKQMRDDGTGRDDPAAMRGAFQEYRTWRETELTNRLGADVAQRVMESDMDKMRGGARRGGPDGPAAVDAAGAPMPTKVKKTNAPGGQ